MLHLYITLASLVGIVLTSAALLYLGAALAFELVRAGWQAARISRWHAWSIREHPTRLDRVHYAQRHLRAHLFWIWVRREIFTRSYGQIRVRGRNFPYLPWREAEFHPSKDHHILEEDFP